MPWTASPPTLLTGHTAGSSIVQGSPFVISGGNNVTVQGTLNTLIINAAGGTGTAGGGGVAIAAGTQTATTDTVVFSNSNGISFGMAGSTRITASYTVPSTTQFLTTAALSNHSHGNPTLALTNLTGTTASASDGFTLSLSAAAPGAGGGIAAAAGTQTGTSGTIVFANSNGLTFGMSNSSQITGSYTVPTQTAYVFSNSNGVSFGTNGSTVTATVKTDYLTTARASNDAIGLATAQSNVTWTVNSAGLSFDARGYAGTGTSATNASVTLNSNGLAISVAAPGGGAAQTFSAGTTSGAPNPVSFADGNGVSFGLNGGTITATVATNYLTTARASNDAIGLNTAGTNVTWTVNSNGLSFNGSGYAGTATGATNASITANSGGISVSVGNYLTSQSNQAVSAANGSSTFQTISFANSNGVSWSTAAAGIWASVNTSYRASNDGIGTNTAQSNVTWTANSAGLSLDARGYAGTGTSATNASLTLNSNGLAISVGAGGGGAAISAAGSSQNAGTVVFSNSNGVSFGMNGSTITATVVPGAAAGIAALGAGTQTATSGTVVFANSNNVTFGLSGSTQVTASVPNSSLAGASGIGISSAGSTISIYEQPVSYYWDWPQGAVSSFQQTNATMSIRRIQLMDPVVFTRIDIPLNVSIGSSAAANTANIVFTSGLGIYTRNGATLSPVAGSIGNTTYTWASNTANYSSILGGRVASFPLTTTLSAGEYYLLLKLSTTNNSSIGTATTAIANTLSMIVGSTYTAVNFAEFGAATSASTTGLQLFQGLCSVDYTNTTQTYQQSQVSMSNTHGVRANFPVRFWST